MKFTLSWLRDHLDTGASLACLVETLSTIGLEVEGVADRGAALAPFRIARVIEARQHPNADRLRVCEVDAGEGTVSVVCGAPNARTGLVGVFAPPGSHIPGSGVDLKIGEIRGVQSAGMLLSYRELGLGEDHSGIIELPHNAPVGTSYAAWAGLDDPVVEIAVTPNRGDALAIRGIARDLAAAGAGTLRPWKPAPVPAAFADGLRWQIAWPDACPWVIGRTIRGLRNGASPDWLQRRLVALGLRPINRLVDITNFFTFDLGRPLHVFDAARVAGDVLTIRPGAGETFRALNGRDYTASAEDCVIADAAGVQSLAGVMGGEATGCDETTRNVFVECALFDPVRIALTGRRHQIVSDARQRFERGIDPALMPDAIEAATRMILDLCGGEPGTVEAAGAEPAWRRDATMRFARLAGLGGAEIAPDDAIAALERLGFTVRRRDSERVTLAVPPWRNDVAAPIALDQATALPVAGIAAEGCAEIEPECDLIEEVLRLRGLDAIPAVSLPRAAPVPAATLSAEQTRTALARRTLAARGLAECVTFSFMSRQHASLFGAAPEALRLTNPIASDLDQLRPTPIATLALAAGRNAARGFADVGLFEIGPAFDNEAADFQRPVAAGLRIGATSRHWATPRREIDALDAKADLLAVLSALGLPMESLGVTRDAPGFYHPGRSGTVRQGPKMVLGHFGQLHPRVCTALDLPGRAVALAVFLDAVPAPKRRRRPTPDLSPYQPIRRDFAFIVDRATEAEVLLRAVRGADRNLVAGAVLFDVYAGDRLAGGKKSLGVEVTFQPRERTLTDQEIEAACDKVVAAVFKATGAALR